MVLCSLPIGTLNYICPRSWRHRLVYDFVRTAPVFIRSIVLLPNWSSVFLGARNYSCRLVHLSYTIAFCTKHIVTGSGWLERVFSCRTTWNNREIITETRSFPSRWCCRCHRHVLTLNSIHDVKCFTIKKWRISYERSRLEKLHVRQFRQNYYCITRASRMLLRSWPS